MSKLRRLILELVHYNPLSDSAQEAADVLGLLEWVGNCAYMTGPTGSKAYFISDEVMARIHKLTKENDDE